MLLVPRIGDRGLAGTGTLAVIEQVGRMPGGEPGAVLRGVSRVKIGHGTTGPGAALWVEGTVIDETGQGARATELAKEYKSLVIATLQKRGAWQVVDMIQQLDDPSTIADRAGYTSYLTAEQKLQLLETADIAERLETAINWIQGAPGRARRRRDDPQGRHRGHGEAAEGVPAAPAARGGPQGAQRADRRRQGHRGGRLPRPASRPPTCRRTSARPRSARSTSWSAPRSSRRRSAGSAPGWTPILDIPWNERTEDAYDIAGARVILDEDHTGLDDVKDRIIEYLAVRKRRSDRGLGVVGGRRSGAVLALVGPPGVGKTSLGESVARAMDRKFVRVALGGVRDEAEIRGHRRTYVGALPGRIVRAIREAGHDEPGRAARRGRQDRL